MKKTKIICTMGPNTDNRQIMYDLVKNGMDVARFNFSHGDYEEQKARMDLLKEVRRELKRPVESLIERTGDPHRPSGRRREGNPAGRRDLYADQPGNRGK